MASFIVQRASASDPDDDHESTTVIPVTTSLSSGENVTQYVLLDLVICLILCLVGRSPIISHPSPKASCAPGAKKARRIDVRRADLLGLVQEWV